MNSRRTGMLALTGALAAVTASGCGVGVHFADYRYTVTPADTQISGVVNDIVVNSGNGHVNITTGGSGVSVHRVVRYQRGGTPHPGQRLVNGTLTFTKNCSRCRIDYDLTVPASVQVHATSDSGRVEVTNVRHAEVKSDSGAVVVRHIGGDVSASADSGSITVEDVSGGLSARTDSGSISAGDVSGALRASTDSGSIRTTGLRSTSVRTSTDSGSTRLSFAVAPVDVHATSDSGSLRIAVPGGPYVVDASSDSGGRDIEIDTSPQASSKIYARTDSGHISILPS